jgi:hypothetical protein
LDLEQNLGVAAHPNESQSEVILQQSEELLDQAALFIALALGR